MKGRAKKINELLLFFIHFEFLNFSYSKTWMVGKTETVLQEVVEEEREIHLDYYLRDTFLHFGETWENNNRNGCFSSRRRRTSLQVDSMQHTRGF